MKKLIALLLLIIFALACAEPAAAAQKKRRYYSRIKFNGPAGMRRTTVHPVFPTDGKKLKTPVKKTTRPKAVGKKRPIIEVLKKPPPPPRRYLIPAAGAGNETFLLGLNYQQRLAGKLNFLIGGGYGFRRANSSFTFKAGGLIDLANNFFAGAALDIANYADKDASGLGLFAGKNWDRLHFSIGYSSALGFNALGGYSLII
ncbi:MAG: hypothetical protein WCW67_00030 [Candidatus Margulisiibacteriota bacterium]